MSPTARIGLSLLAMLAVLSCTVAAAHAQDTAADEGELSLEIVEFDLDNGMHVILHEDDTLPLVAVNIWYRVGSRDERAGRSGFAHLFEHLMFMGTRRAPDFDVIMESGGGWNNASTSEDYTNYYAVGPTNLLPTLLWLEADRLDLLADDMTTEKLDIQRGVVRNERRQNYEIEPYGAVWLAVPELIYPEDSGYHHPVIGSHEDLEAATLDDVTGFFREHYVPSNASLVVAGDIDLAETRALVERYFGALPAAEAPERAPAPSHPTMQAQRVTLTDDVQATRIHQIWHSPAFYAPGDAELDIASRVLSSGKTSRLYSKLVYEDELATDVAAYQYSMGWSSVFVIEITVAPDVDVAEVEAATEAVIERLRADGPTDDEVERARNNIEAGFVRNLQSIAERADLLNRYRTYVGRADYLADDLARYRQASAESVHAAIRVTLAPEARLTLVIEPDGEGDVDAEEVP